MKHFLTFFLILSAVFLTVTFTAHAQVTPKTYYVSTTGSDSDSNGTESNPFKTIKFALDKTNPGDTVYVKGGTYKEKITINRAGTSGSIITLAAYGNEKPIIDGTGVYLGPDGEQEKLVVIYSPYTKVKGFEIRNSFGKGVSIEADNVTLEGNNIHDNKKYGIGVRDRANITILNNQVWNNVLQNVNGDFYQGNGGWESALSFSKSTNILIQGNSVHNNWGEGIMCWGESDGCIIRNNTSYDNYGVNIYNANARNTIIENNLVYETNTTYVDGSVPKETKKLAVGISVNTEDSSCGARDVTIRNNIVIRTRSGIKYYKYADGCTGLINLKAEHNTFINTWEYTINVGNSTTNTGQNTGNTFKNNILYRSNVAFGPFSGFINYYNPSSNFTKPVFQNNIFYNSAGQTNNLYRFNGSSYALDAVPTAFASTIGNLTTDPQFVNATGVVAANYKISNTSPAINNGTYVGVTQDHFGTTRNPNAADIGAHEYVSSVPSVVGFTLINAISNVPISGFTTMNNGDVIKLTNTVTKNLAIKVNTDAEVVGSVVIKLNGKQVKLENVAPYTYTFPVLMLKGGTFTIEATPYTQINKGGTMGTKKSITFTIQK